MANMIWTHPPEGGPARWVAVEELGPLPEAAPAPAAAPQPLGKLTSLHRTMLARAAAGEPSVYPPHEGSLPCTRHQRASQERQAKRLAAAGLLAPRVDRPWAYQITDAGRVALGALGA
jgi:hypothetical protein